MFQKDYPHYHHDYDALANSIQKLNPEFQKFSLTDFRGTFNELHRNYGLGFKCFFTTYIFCYIMNVYLFLICSEGKEFGSLRETLYNKLDGSCPFYYILIA